MKQHHVIDPMFFYEAVEEFALDCDWYYESDVVIDEFGEKKTKFVKDYIRGSLQSQGTSLNQRKEGNTENMKYEFYCMAKYRIKIGDFIFYKNRWLHVEGVHDYDEWGVRSATLTMINLNNYKDLEESVRFLEGLEIV